MAIAGGVGCGAEPRRRPRRATAIAWTCPPHVQWAEADFPHLIEYKHRMLGGACAALPAAARGRGPCRCEARRKFLAEVLPAAKKVIGAHRGRDSLSHRTAGGRAGGGPAKPHPRFAFWIGEYFSPRVYPYLRSAARSRVMANAPFQFFPPDMTRVLRAPWLGETAAALQRRGGEANRAPAAAGTRWGRQPMKLMSPE